MSYQLIYTVRTQESETTGANATAVVRTRSMSADLERFVAQRTLRIARAVADEPTFCYTTVPDGGELFHVLVSARRGQDGARTIHHLVLRDSERCNLLRADDCATPAGVALMLELQRFWAKEWRGQPTIMDEAEACFRGTCPSPHMCATWKVLTGHATSAWALQQAPYCDGCVVSLPVGVRTRDMLSLLHESDAQREDRGWGMGFCVPTMELRLPERKERLFCMANSPLKQRAREAETPVLELRPGLTAMPSAETLSPKIEDTLPPPPGDPSESAARLSPLAALPVMMSCRHAEYSSADLLELNSGAELPRKSYILPVVIGSAVVLCGAAMLPGLLSEKSSEPRRPSIPSVRDKVLSPAPAAEDDVPLPTVKHKRSHADVSPSQSR